MKDSEAFTIPNDLIYNSKFLPNTYPEQVIENFDEVN